MKRTLLLAALAAVVLTGCVTRTMTLPPNFINVDKDAMGIYAVRAVAPDGAMVSLRTEKNPQNGTLDFWTQAVTNQLTQGRGYKVVKSEEVTSDAGLPGRLLTFSTERKGVTFTYLVALFLQGQEILIAEAGGKSEAMDPRAAELCKSLLTAK